MTLLSKNVYVNKLDNIVNEYNNAYHMHTSWCKAEQID